MLGPRSSLWPTAGKKPEPPSYDREELNGASILSEHGARPPQPSSQEDGSRASPVRGTQPVCPAAHPQTPRDGKRALPELLPLWLFGFTAKDSEHHHSCSWCLGPGLRWPLRNLSGVEDSLANATGHLDATRHSQHQEPSRTAAGLASESLREGSGRENGSGPSP